MAAAYAYDRPAVHRHIVWKIREHLGIPATGARALDIGCGAGRSTAAIDPLADLVVGIDCAAAMLQHRRSVAPRARFVVGQAEALPFADSSFHLITAAGSINYANLDLAGPEAARVLTRQGTMVVYDFSAGRRFADSPKLGEWYTEFERRYPDTPGYALDITALPFERWGLALESYRSFEVALDMSPEAYLAYAMSETRVERAILEGMMESEIRKWCRTSLGKIFEGAGHDVIFDAYTAYISRR
jgi:ubiquinone/menaquinone biosynthesis C-methylase UbiE